VQTLLFRSLANERKKVKGDNFLKNLTTKSNDTGSQYIYKNMHPNKPSSQLAQRNVQNLSRVGRRLGNFLNQQSVPVMSSLPNPAEKEFKETN